jgi:hypothetical protein
MEPLPPIMGPAVALGSCPAAIRRKQRTRIPRAAGDYLQSVHMVNDAL